MIPYGRQDIGQEDIEAVVRVLKSDWLTQGPVVPQFENAVASYCGARYGVALNSATSALHAACAALDVGPGDIIWTAANTFVATANCALYCGACFDLVDISLEDGNINPDALEAKLKKANRDGRLPKVVIPVHFAGEPCNMARIYSLSKQFGFRVIEDASHAVGGSLEGKPVGDCRYSDITVFSFHAVKVMTSGEGGLATTNDQGLAIRMQRFRSHGITRENSLMESGSHGPWYYEMIELGYNYRMTDIQAALGLSQLTRLDGFVNRRHALAERYDEALAKLPVKIPVRNRCGRSAIHLYILRIKLNEIGKSRKEIVEELHRLGIRVNVHYIPLYYHPYYKNFGFCKADFPATECQYQESITLPLFSKLSEEGQQQVIGALYEVIAV